MTAAAIGHGVRSRNSGVYISLGHGVVEVPLILILYLGASALFQHNATRITIGLAGGVFLLYMGLGLMRVKPLDVLSQPTSTRSSFITGMLLSIGNPYFLLWWATIGLGLVLGAERFGLMGVIAFIIVHWLCDLIWFTILSRLSYKGVETFGASLYHRVSFLCGIALLIFGGLFIVGSTRLLLSVT
jgi:threonine/homoserine/homoserine lactone efflux protein